MQTSMTGRPRPVTATVTKPKWMQIPDPDAMAKIRRRSLDSNGSTESLTSLLDHESYISDNEDKTEDLDGTYSLKNPVEEVKVKRKVHSSNARPKKPQAVDSEFNSRAQSKQKSSNGSLSAWEQWVIQKAKDDRRKRIEEKKKKREEKAEQEKVEQEKQLKLKKAESVRQQWVERKDQERDAQRKVEKEKIRMSKKAKEANDADIKVKSEKKFAEWMSMKKVQETQKKQKIKEENLKIQEHEEMRKVKAEQRFQEWLKQAHKRPKTAPNSFGYLSGKMTGYHDRTAYPLPTFYNPIPWHPPSVPPSSQKSDKLQKPKTKPYKWNPEKYF